MIAAEVCTENTACLLNTKIIPDFFSSFCDTHDKICLLHVFVVVMFVCFFTNTETYFLCTKNDIFILLCCGIRWDFTAQSCLSAGKAHNDDVWVIREVGSCTRGSQLEELLFLMGCTTMGCVPFGATTATALYLYYSTGLCGTQFSAIPSACFPAGRHHLGRN